MKKLAILAILAVCATSFANSKGDRLVAEIKDLKPPQFDQSKQQDQAYIKTFRSKYNQYLTQKNDLILQLYQTDPTNEKTADLMTERWMRFPMPEGNDMTAAKDKDVKDIDKILAQNPPEAIKEAGEYCKVILDGEFGGDRELMKKESDAFIAKYPKSTQAPMLLYQESFQMKDDEKTATYKRILANYPNFKEAPMIKGALQQTEAVGKPFALKFTDAVGGKDIDISNLKGKVVLVDFWATWCGPCVAEMPAVKDMYSKYHAKGLEILGVSLDEKESDGGLTKLKDFVAKNQIPWPMYYQGNGWDSTFSSSWGIMSIPSMFIVDKSGNFVGVADARDPNFTARIEKLLGS
jgi:thiol-disulfide isomerase/thioredoxin